MAARADAAPLSANETTWRRQSTPTQSSLAPVVNDSAGAPTNDLARNNFLLTGTIIFLFIDRYNNFSILYIVTLYPLLNRRDLLAKTTLVAFEANIFLISVMLL